jgi:hypothetical protein
MDAGVDNFLGLRSKPEGENRHGGRLPAQPGRQEAGCNKFLGFTLQNPKAKNGKDAVCRRSRAGMEAGVNNYLGLRSKPKALKRHGCRFRAAQGIEAEIPEAPRPYPHAKRVG